MGMEEILKAIFDGHGQSAKETARISIPPDETHLYSLLERIRQLKADQKEAIQRLQRLHASLSGAIADFWTAFEEAHPEAKGVQCKLNSANREVLIFGPTSDDDKCV